MYVKKICVVFIALFIFAISLNTESKAKGHKLMSDDKLIISQGDLQIKVLSGANTVDWRAARIFIDVINERTGLKIPLNVESDAKYTLVIGNQTNYDVREYTFDHHEILKLKNDGYCIDTKSDDINHLHIIGDTPSGVVAGIGRLMRMAEYEQGRLLLPKINIISNPVMPVRGVYFASHFGNFYEVAPLTEVNRYIEDMALWGANTLMVWFDQHQYKDFNDPAAKVMIDRLRHFGITAQRMGMKFGLTALGNEGYGGSPEEYRVKVLNPGNYGVEMCPSIPEALDLIVKNQEEILKAFDKVDTVWIWPYDQGGCWCDKCHPWGGNGFLKAAEKLAPMYKKHSPNIEIWLSTWKMDYFGHMQGEIDGVINYIRNNKPTWLTGIITGQDEYATQKALLDRPNPERYPLASFPEISMYNMYPWGGFGATSLPAFNDKVQSLMRDFIVGGWVYSEGIFEDLSKFHWMSFYWDPNVRPDDVLKEYASYYLNPSVSDDFVKMAHILEKTHTRTNWIVKTLEGADEAWRLAESIDSNIDDWSRNSWRWRLFKDRAAIDNILLHNSPASKDTQDMLKPYTDDIIKISSLYNTHLRPPDFLKSSSPNNAAFGKKVTVSSTHKEYAGSEMCLVNGILPESNPQDFWVNDPEIEKTSAVTIDLDEVTDIDEIRLQFRSIEGRYWFVPSSVAFYGSIDGVNFDPISIMYLDPSGIEYGPFVSVKTLPKEDSAYIPELTRFKIAGGSRSARYVRVELGESQRQVEPFKGMIELTEIEISKK